MAMDECPYCSKGLNRYGRRYCMFNGLSPISNGEVEDDIEADVVWGEDLPVCGEDIQWDSESGSIVCHKDE
jgi:hypothetical protein